MNATNEIIVPNVMHSLEELKLSEVSLEAAMRTELFYGIVNKCEKNVCVDNSDKGSGNGNGDGDGSGNGDGNAGDGSGSGDGNGDGDGSGDGNGDGDGNGYSIC